MKPFVVQPLSCLKGEISFLGDKSIAHRSIIISALAKSTTSVKNFPLNKDCLFTLSAIKKLGIRIAVKKDSRGLSATLKISGRGLFGLKEPNRDIFVGDSGTTLRLLLGILAGQNFKTRLTAGKYLSGRPMLRVTQPLRLMGASITTRHPSRVAGKEEYPPITIRGGRLKAITYKMPIASAQVKSALLFAGIYAHGKTKIIERLKTRDHTERMLKLFKANISVEKNSVTIKGKKELISPRVITLPGDISSAAFFIVLATLTKNSQVILKNITLNQTRTGILKVLKRMGADIRIKYRELKIKDTEPAGDIIIKSSPLRGARIKKAEVPFLIDEIPVLTVAASLAKGISVFEDVGELRVKETDRIRSISENLIKMGACIKTSGARGKENIIIKGVKHLKGAKVRSFGDHRTAMSMIVAGVAAVGRTEIDDVSCINKSSPDFLKILHTLTK